MMISSGVARALFLAAIALIAPACDPPRGDKGDLARRPRAASGEFANALTWGCEHAVLSKVDKLDRRWREEATVVGDFGFDMTVGDFSGFRPHKRADIQVKLPVTIEGHSGATVWIPRRERDRVALILSDVPRRGPGNSYRIEDGHQEVRFEPCVDKNWSAWVAGLALADRKEIAMKVTVDGARRPSRVTLGPWRS